MDGMDLDMLAPYISMDDDFQLTFLSSLPEQADKPLPSVKAAAAASRKRWERLIRRQGSAENESTKTT